MTSRSMRGSRSRAGPCRRSDRGSRRPGSARRRRGKRAPSLRLPLIASTRAQPPLAEEDRDEQGGDAEEFAEAASVDRRAYDRDKQQERQESSGRRHEDDASGHAEGGS